MALCTLLCRYETFKRVPDVVVYPGTVNVCVESLGSVLAWLSQSSLIKTDAHKSLFMWMFDVLPLYNVLEPKTFTSAI